jgi:Trypsin-like peptidase domain/Gram-negative bacterial TonB protein C-terminal
MLRHLHRSAAAAALACALALSQDPVPKSPPIHDNAIDDRGVPSVPPLPDGMLDDRALSFALCPIVYQVDNVPGPRGYHYLFYGNAFFINRDGYLLTAAHVLSQLHGGQPFLLLRIPNAEPRFVPAAVIALDRDHDIAILRATPNPFDSASPFRVSILQLAYDAPAPGRTVVLAALRPFRPRDAYTLESSLEERSPGEILSFEFSQLEKGRPADTELFLISHSVEPGQSGAPVISPDTQQVVGLVEGQWLRTSLGLPRALGAPPARFSSGHGFSRAESPQDIDAASAAEGPVGALSSAIAHPIQSKSEVGAVIPIHYALALLQQKGIAWQSSPGHSNPDIDSNTAATNPGVLPSPLSLVPAPYPSQSLFGGEVTLDALVTRSGTLADVKLIHGDSPLADKALYAVRTWIFTPARTSANATSHRISIIFQFPQPYVPPRKPTTHEYEDASSAPAHFNVALPLTTVEAQYPPATNSEGSVILYAQVNPEGQIASIEAILDFPPFTDAALHAARQWRFTPAPKATSATDSPTSAPAENRAAILVFIFRRPLTTQRTP